MTVTTETYRRPHVRFYHASADYVRRHPLWLRATKTPFATKVTKYTLGSVIAFVMSDIAFLTFYLLGFGTTVCSVAGFLFGAVPNWILNRRWAWEKTGRASTKQIVTYIGVSAFVLFTTSWASGWTHDHTHSLASSHGLRALVVTAAYVAVTVVLFVVKFVIYEYWVFHDGSRVRAALRSLMNVTKMARANRMP